MVVFVVVAVVVVIVDVRAATIRITARRRCRPSSVIEAAAKAIPGGGWRERLAAKEAMTTHDVLTASSISKREDDIARSADNRLL